MSNVHQASALKTEQLLREAKLLLRDGKHTQSIDVLQTILSSQPAHRDALYYLAVCLRRQGEHKKAFATLDNLLVEHPGYGRAYQDYGHNYSALEKSEKAAQHFVTAVSLNPSLIASWKALAAYNKEKGNVAEAEEALRHVKYLSKLPPELITVSSLLYEDKINMAEQLCRQFLQKHAHHPEAMRLLADIGSRLQIFDDAEFLLEKCVEFYPDFHHARSDYVKVLHKRQKFEKALEQAEKLLAIDASNIAFEVSLASSHQAVGNFDEALRIYDGILNKDKGNHLVYSARGHALKTIGRTSEAIQSYQGAYTASPSYGDAYWSLANLKTYKFSSNEIADMREQQALASTSTTDKIHLCFALGKALEDRKEFAESFKFYEKGNQLKRESSRYDSLRIEAEFTEQINLFDTNFFAERETYGCDSAAPIFVVGLPRAGSTLIEQILASHSQIDGTMELANVIGLAHRLGGRGSSKQSIQYPNILGQLTDQHFMEFGENFIRDTQIHRQSAPYFIDKMPNNFRHIALINLMLPKAKIIDARREPMACCFSGFKQLFAEGQEFTYSLEAIGRYYQAYVDLMNHWDTALPGRVLRVQHEDVIEDLETQVRRILDYCGLPFEQSCVDFHKTERAVRTPSSEQVRQPIYKSSMQQWENYAEFLEPLVVSLGTAKENY